MEIIKTKAYARAGLLGNPSDGYNGKTISVCIPQYYAQVTLYEWEQVEIVPCLEDQSQFESVGDLVHDVVLHGYYGGVRLIKASIKRFVEYCHAKGETLHNRNFSIRYETKIPRQVGMAGSSAIITATMRALMKFYNVDIPPYLLASLVLSVEMQELHITAGLQDRVIQAYEGMVYMDFDKKKMKTVDGLTYGAYKRMTIPSDLPLYVAFKADVSEPTEIFHNNLRARFDMGETAVVDAMKRFAQIAFDGKRALESHDYKTLNQLIDANFDLRRSICKLPAGQVEMIEVARQCGASAKFAGSGGAIVGLYQNPKILAELKKRLGQLGCSVEVIDRQ